MRHLVQPKVIPQCGEIDKELVDPAVVVLRKIFRARTGNDCGVKSFLPKLYEFAGKASYAGRRASRATARGDLDIGCWVFMPGTPAARTRHRCPPYDERCDHAIHADSAPLRGLCVAANRVVACRSLRRFYNYRSIPATLQGDES